MATAAPVIKPYQSSQAVAIRKIKRVFFSASDLSGCLCGTFAMSYSYDVSVDERTCHSVYETLKNNGKVSTAVLQSVM